MLAPNIGCGAAQNCSNDAATTFAVSGAWPPEAQAIIDGAGALRA